MGPFDFVKQSKVTIDKMDLPKQKFCDNIRKIESYLIN